MTSISNLFSNFTDLTKTINDHAKEYKENKVYLNTPSPAINQGEKFKRYQNKIKKNLVKKTRDFAYFNKEAFQNIEDNLHLSSNGLTAQSNNIIQNNDYSSQQQTISNLKQQYQNTLTEYENLVAQISGSTTGYLNRVNPNNPYLGKNVRFNNGSIGYVTQQGVVKWYGDWDTYTACAGKNGCPSQQEIIDIDIHFDTNYWIAGTTIPTNPPLLSGTSMVAGQSCGNEGKNVFVNEMIKNPNITYEGCYADNQQSPLMTFIGGTPPPPSGTLQNGNFDQPQMANNSYKYINSFTDVPGWYFGACLINNSTAWGYPMPYPTGSQAACLQAQEDFVQWIYLSSGTYTISFYACGRPGYEGGNEVNVICGYDWSAVVYRFTPPVTAWQQHSFTVNLQESKIYAFGFQGQNPSGNFATAIQGIQINRNGEGNSGSYTYEQCKEAAINSGYQYFALQDVNPSTSQGYCAVSNDQPSITKLGASLVPRGMQALWASNTASSETNNPGSTATLSINGSLTVLNSSGTAVYASDNSNATPGNYLGCYQDNATRAMPLLNNDGTMSTSWGGSKWDNNYQSAFNYAQQNGYKYFSTQAANSEGYGQAGFSNSLSQTTEYGPARNCSNEGGIINGGGWSNAVYSTNQTSNYFLILQDDGNVVIYRGTGPSDNQGAIWSTGTNGRQQQANPVYAAAKGKYGQNWISQGATLAAGDFIGSTNGNMALIMQSDGNLVLYTFTMTSNCQKMKDGNNGGGLGANAIYNIGEVGKQSNLTQVAYIDQNAELHAYPSSNTQYDNSYTELNGTDSSGYDIPGAAYGNATPESCKSTCNSNPDCAGFAFSNNVCWPKTSGMYPNGAKQINQNSHLYVRNKTPISTPIGVPLTTNNTDSVTYGKYVNGGQLGNEYGLANATSAQKAQLSQLQSQMNLLSNQLSNYTNEFGQGSQQAEAQSKTNVVGLQEYLQGIKKTNSKINTIRGDENIENILKDSDIVVLQKNYDYLFWSILAVGSVLVAMNVAKQ